jgi:hypothetical protein
MLEDAKIVAELNRVFEGAKNYQSQEDNAPPHRAARKKSSFSSNMDLLAWPPNSPDLSPIEHIWEHLKMKLEGHEFSSPEELFGFLVQEWDNLRAELIDGYCTSFSARLQIYQQINGECLNWHWKDAHCLRDQLFEDGPGRREEDNRSEKEGENRREEEEEDRREDEEEDQREEEEAEQVREDKVILRKAWMEPIWLLRNGIGNGSELSRRFFPLRMRRNMCGNGRLPAICHPDCRAGQQSVGRNVLLNGQSHMIR